jgi:hypothetical protein
LVVELVGAFVPMLLHRDIEQAQRVVPATASREPDSVFITVALRAAQLGVQLGEEGIELLLPPAHSTVGSRTPQG